MTYADLDRLFFENLRLTLVANGMVPDVKQYLTDSEWRQARKDLSAQLAEKQLEIIDIFNVAAGDDRGTLKNSRFTIGRGRQERGSIGVGPFPYKEPTGDTFRELEHLDFNKDIVYELRVFSNSTEEEMYMLALLDATFGQRRYLHTVNNEGLNTAEIALVEWNGGSDIEAVGNQREYLYEYVVRDVWIGQEKVLRTGVPRLTTVDFFVYSQSTALGALPNQIINYNELPNS